MRFQTLTVFLIASICSAQTPIAAPSAVANSASNAPTPPAGPSDAVTLAKGTTVPLTLVNPVKSNSTKPGDTVRAVVAFPVTVGTQLAIPAGTYVEGIVNAVTARTPHTHLPRVQIHFTRLLFANGYSVKLDAANSEAMMIVPGMDRPATYEVADASGGAPFLGDRFGRSAQASPASLPSVGPSPAAMTGIVLGGFVSMVAVGYALLHHHGGTDYVLFDNGWQFQMVLQSPLTVDAGKVSAAASLPAAN